RWHGAPAEVHQEIHQVYLAPWPLGEPPEFGELLRELVEPLCLWCQHLERHRPTVRPFGSAPELVYRDPHGRERILDLVRDAARHLAERPQALRLELALARGMGRRRQLAQCLTQRFNLGSPAGGWTRRQRHAAPD